jgi:hypothetical protein
MIPSIKDMKIIFNEIYITTNIDTDNKYNAKRVHIKTNDGLVDKDIGTETAPKEQIAKTVQDVRRKA